MDQAAGRPIVFDRKIARIAWDLDRVPVSTPAISAAHDLDGLLRALTLAVPVSALLWIGAAAIVATAIR